MPSGGATQGYHAANKSIWRGSGSVVPTDRPFPHLLTPIPLIAGIKLSDTRVDELQIRARLGTTAHFCKVAVLKLRAVPS